MKKMYNKRKGYFDKERFMKILYGTTNNAKLIAMKNAIKTLDIELIGLNDLECEIPSVEESGKSPLENAQIKAKTYYEAFGMPVFSCDSGLYIDELEADEQPGVHVRRIDGKELSDDEMIRYYSSLAEKHGGRLTARYRNAICFVFDENIDYSSMDDSLATEPFLLVSKPHKKRVQGFPLDCLSKDIGSGKYYYDIKEKDPSTSALEEGFKMFFTNIIEKSHDFK